MESKNTFIYYDNILGSDIKALRMGAGTPVFSRILGGSNMRSVERKKVTKSGYSSVMGTLGFEPRSAGLFPVHSSSQSSPHQLTRF